MGNNNIQLEYYILLLINIICHILFQDYYCCSYVCWLCFVLGRVGVRLKLNVPLSSIVFPCHPHCCSHVGCVLYLAVLGLVQY